MREMIGRGAVEHGIVVEQPAHEVVDIGAALRGVVEGICRGEDVVVDEVRPVRDFDEQVAVVALKDIGAHAQALRLPVEPHAEGALVQVVVVHIGIDGGVQLDAAQLVPVKLVPGADAEDLVAVNFAERRPHVPHDAVLSAVVDLIPPHDVRADLFFAPADRERLEHRFQLVLVARLSAPFGEVVVARRLLFAQTDAAALGVVDDIVFDHPALAPVGADDAPLLGRGRRPGRCRLRHLKAADGDVVYPRPLGEEACLAHVELDEGGVGVGTLEVGVQHRLLFARLRIPAQQRRRGVDELFLSPSPRFVDALFPFFGMKYLVKRRGFKQRPAVQIYRRGVHLVIARGDQPVAVDLGAEWIVVAEDAAVDGRLPHVPFHALPVFRPLGALDDDGIPRRRHVGDGQIAAKAAVFGLDPFPVYPLVHDDGIPRRGDIRRPLNGAERLPLRAGSIVRTALGNVVDHGRILLLSFSFYKTFVAYFRKQRGAPLLFRCRYLVFCSRGK